MSNLQLTIVSHKGPMLTTISNTISTQEVNWQAVQLALC